MTPRLLTGLALSVVLAGCGSKVREYGWHCAELWNGDNGAVLGYIRCSDSPDYHNCFIETRMCMICNPWLP